MVSHPVHCDLADQVIAPLVEVQRLGIFATHTILLVAWYYCCLMLIFRARLQEARRGHVALMARACMNR